MKLPEPIATFPKAFTAMADAVNGLLAWAKPWDRMTVGTGLTLKKADTGHLLTVNVESVAGPVLATIQSRFGGLAHPFQVQLTNPAGPTAAIIAESYFYTSLSQAAPGETISSLTSSITLGTSTKIWLKVSVNSSLSVTAATITTTNPTNLITLSGSTQTEFHVLIGKVESGSNTDAPGFDFTLSGATYHFEQTLFTHLVMQFVVFNGAACVYALPFSAR